MKKLILLLLLPNLIYAQKYELGIGLGISSNSFNSAYANTNAFDYSGKKTINFSSLISVYKNMSSHIQLGFAINPTTLSYNEQLSGVLSSFPNNDTTTLKIKNIIANPAIPILLIGNYKLKHLYLGIGIGYDIPVTIESKTSDNNFSQTEVTRYYYSKATGGLVYNIHAGYTNWLTKRVGIDILASYNSTSFSETKVFIGGTISYYTIIAGIKVGI